MGKPKPTSVPEPDIPRQKINRTTAGEPTGFLAILSDIHANVEALDAVLEDVRKWPVREIICLGDIVGRGADPSACVERIRTLSVVCLLGNHEQMLNVQVGTLTQWGQFADLVDPTRGQLSFYLERWLLTRPLTWTGHGAEFFHASLHEPEGFHYVDSRYQANRNFAAQREFISFHGHTHIPAIWEENGPSNSRSLGEDPTRLDPAMRYAIGVGSVGYSRDGDPRASYVLYDPTARIVFPRRIAYDALKARRRLRDAGVAVDSYQGVDA